jgi:Ala-tRNA(Pro) deacylase
MNDVLKILEEKNIDYTIIQHEEVHTMEDMNNLGLLDKGYVFKNLFLRNANGKEHYLLSCGADKEINIKELATKIGSSRLSFASSERLEKYLGLEQGYVSPLGIINDINSEVTCVFEKEIKDDQIVGVHPNTNKATIYLKYSDLIKIIKEHGNNIMFIEI